MANTAEVNSNDFAGFLRTHRGFAGLTQKQVAARTGVSGNYITLLETRQRLNPSAGFLVRLTQALGLSEQDRVALFEAAGKTEMMFTATSLPTPNNLHVSPESIVRILESGNIDETAAHKPVSPREERGTAHITTPHRSGRPIALEAEGIVSSQASATPQGRRLAEAVQSLVTLLADPSVQMERRTALAEEFSSYGQWRLTQETAKASHGVMGKLREEEAVQTVIGSIEVYTTANEEMKARCLDIIRGASAFVPESKAAQMVEAWVDGYARANEQMKEPWMSAIRGAAGRVPESKAAQLAQVWIAGLANADTGMAWRDAIWQAVGRIPETVAVKTLRVWLNEFTQASDSRKGDWLYAVLAVSRKVPQTDSLETIWAVRNQFATIVGRAWPWLGGF